MRQLCRGTAVGNERNSDEVLFCPGALTESNQERFTADTQTAGSICLLMQVSVPPALFGPRAVSFEVISAAAWLES